MRKIYVCISILLLLLKSNIASAQFSADHYTFSNTTTTYTSLNGSGTTLSTPGDDNVAYPSFPIGFTFTYAGTVYTNLYVCSNGFIAFTNDETGSTNGSSNSANTLTSTSDGNLVAPLWNDLVVSYTPPSVAGLNAKNASGKSIQQKRAGTFWASLGQKHSYSTQATYPDGSISYLLSGKAGSRVLTIEFNSMYQYNDDPLNYFSFQVKFYEGTNVVEFVYGPANGTPTTLSASIGILNVVPDGESITNYFTSVTPSKSPTTSTTTPNDTISILPSTGVVYDFTPPVMPPNPLTQYLFSSTTTTYTSLNGSGTTLSTPGDDDVAYPSFPIGFTFTYAGTVYTNLYVCSNGFIAFTNDSTGSQNGADDYVNSLTLTNVGNLAAPLWDDLVVSSSSGGGDGADVVSLATKKVSTKHIQKKRARILPNSLGQKHSYSTQATYPDGSISYLLSGTKGSRVLTIEYNSMIHYYDQNNIFSFQVKLYEGTNVVEFVYGPTIGSPSLTASIGLLDVVNSFNYFLSVTPGTPPTTSTTVANDTVSTFPDSSVVYDFTPSATLPVELTNFTGKPAAGKVFLNWTTATEKNNAGFDIERATKSLTPAFSKVGFVKGNGTSTASHSYTFTDKAAIGTVLYRLKQTDYNGKFAYSPTIEITAIAPTAFTLSQNYPNPFNPTTAIDYQLANAANIKLVVYDILGRAVQTLVSGRQPAGSYHVIFDASRLSSGVYFYKLIADNFTATKKLLLVK